jgi:hypothetical protein
MSDVTMVSTKRLRALESVARAAGRDLDHLADELCVTRAELLTAEDTTGRLARALSRLSPSKAPRGRAGKGGANG